MHPARDGKMPCPDGGIEVQSGWVELLRHDLRKSPVDDGTHCAKLLRGRCKSN